VSRELRALALVCALALLGGGCGGGGRSSADRWRDTASKACDQRADAVLVASAQLTAESTPEQFAAWFRQFFEPAYRAQLDTMRSASPPDDTARTLLKDTTAVVDTMAADPASFAVAVDPFATVDAGWDAYGLTACGSRGA
jgi:hypothetical protein